MLIYFWEFFFNRKRNFENNSLQMNIVLMLHFDPSSNHRNYYDVFINTVLLLANLTLEIERETKRDRERQRETKRDRERERDNVLFVCASL